MLAELRQLAGLNVEALGFKPKAEHLLDHHRIVAETLGKFAGRAPGLKDSKLHGSAIATV